MKKGLIIAIAAVVALILVVGGIIIANCFAPDFSIEGTYKAENGDTATVTETKVVFSSGEEVALEALNFDFEYIGSAGTYQFRVFNAGSDEFVFHKENGSMLFTYKNVQYNLAD